jgi:hypothetical protein
MHHDRDLLERSDAQTALQLARKRLAAADRALADNGISAAAGWAPMTDRCLRDDVRQIDISRERDNRGAARVEAQRGLHAGMANADLAHVMAVARHVELHCDRNDPGR